MWKKPLQHRIEKKLLFSQSIYSIRNIVCFRQAAKFMIVLARSNCGSNMRLYIHVSPNSEAISFFGQKAASQCYCINIRGSNHSQRNGFCDLLPICSHAQKQKGKNILSLGMERTNTASSSFYKAGVKH